MMRASFPPYRPEVGIRRISPGLPLDCLLTASRLVSWNERGTLGLSHETMEYGVSPLHSPWNIFQECRASQASNMSSQPRIKGQRPRVWDNLLGLKVQLERMNRALKSEGPRAGCGLLRSNTEYYALVPITYYYVCTEYF